MGGEELNAHKCQKKNRKKKEEFLQPMNKDFIECGTVAKNSRVKQIGWAVVTATTNRRGAGRDWIEKKASRLEISEVGETPKSPIDLWGGNFSKGKKSRSGGRIRGEERIGGEDRKSLWQIGSSHPPGRCLRVTKQKNKTQKNQTWTEVREGNKRRHNLG